ncbi:hypothetical protein JCM15519_04200 [Fundidesulfovibrio butyratiphilus]
MSDMLHIRIESEIMTAALRRLAASARDRTPAMRKAAGIMADAVEENFDEEGRPKWKSLAAATVRQRTKERSWPGKILQRSGNLARSITRHYDADSAIVGTNTIYAAIQNFGGKGGRGQKVQIPAREFLHLEPEDEEDIERSFARFLGEAAE